MRKKLISIFAFAYTTWILMWFALWLVIGDGSWWLTLLNRVAPYMFLLAPILLVLTVLFRRYRLTALLFVPLLVFFSLYHPYLFPRPAQVDGNPDLSVMTYNVLFSNSDYDAVANVILTYRPDLVALQEVQPALMGELERRLAGMYPYSMMGYENRYGTTAVFSRYPITEAYVLDLEADRPAAVLKTEVNGKEITFISAHLLAYGLRWVKLPDLPHVVKQRTASQNNQGRLLVEEIEKQEGDVILACDCNSKETSSSYRILAKAMANTARLTGWMVGDPAVANVKQDTNLQHIDYVFFRGALEPLNVYTIQDSGGSDHLPVQAFFKFVDEPL